MKQLNVFPYYLPPTQVHGSKFLLQRVGIIATPKEIQGTKLHTLLASVTLSAARETEF